MGVHFRNVGVHWVLYPHATSHPAAPALRMPAAAPMHPWQARHKATAPAVAHTQQRSHIHKPPPHGPAAQLNPPRAHPGTVCECGSNYPHRTEPGRTYTRGAGVHRPPSTLSKRDALAHRWGSNYPHHAEPLRTRAQWPRSFRHASRDGRASRSAPHATPDNVHRPFHALSAFLPPLAFLRGNSGNSGNTA